MVLVDAGIKLLLENGIDYTLTGDEYSNGRIYNIRDGHAEIIGISNTNQISIDHLKYKDIKNIRGISLNERPSDKFLSMFNSLNPEKVFIDSDNETPIHPQAKFLEFSVIGDNYNLALLDFEWVSNRNT